MDSSSTSLLASLVLGDKLSSSVTSAIYHETSSDHRKCGFCKKSESREQPLMCCGKCKQLAYCSKECQAKHWPEHKVECKFMRPALDKEDSGSDLAETVAPLEARVDKFSYDYKPLIMHFTFWATSDPSTLREYTEPRVLVLHLEDLDDSCPSPRLGIKDWFVVPLASQLERIQEAWHQYKARSPQIMGPKFRRFEMCILYYSIPEFPNRPYLSFIPTNYDAAVCPPTPHLLRARTVEEKGWVLRTEAHRLFEGINDMAHGRAQDLKKAAKLPKSTKNKNINNKKKRKNQKKLSKN